MLKQAKECIKEVWNKELKKLPKVVQEHLDMDKLYDIIGLSETRS